MDVDSLRGAMGPRTRAVVPVHLYGQCVDVDAIAAVADGDTIVFDIPNRTLNVELTDEQIKQRLVNWKAPAPRFTSGVMAKYAFLVSSSSRGAVTALPQATSQPVQSGRTL